MKPALQSSPGVLLIRPDDGSVQGEFSLGLAYVARALLNAGVPVNTLCCDVYPVEDSTLMTLIRRSGVRVFCIGAQYPAFQEVIRLVRLIRLVVEDAIIVLGGYLVSPIPEFVLRKTGADIACVGEGERAVVEVMAALSSGSGVEGIPGVAHLCGGEFRPPAPASRAVALESDASGWPAWDVFPVERYVSGPAYYPFLPGDRVFSVITSRGCPYSCNFCYHPGPYRVHDVNGVLEQIAYLTERYHLTGFYVESDLFMIDKSYVMAFCEGLRHRDLNVAFTVTGRFDSVDRDMLAALRAAGCITVFYGAESGDPEILRDMGKGITVEQIKEGVRLTREAGIFCRVGMMFGQPRETRDSLARTVRLLKDLCYGSFEERYIYGCVPFPGSKLYDECLAGGLLKDHDDFYRRFSFDQGALRQMPVNMTAILDRPVLDLLNEANRELAAYYEVEKTRWMPYAR